MISLSLLKNLLLAAQVIELCVGQIPNCYFAIAPFLLLCKNGHVFHKSSKANCFSIFLKTGSKKASKGPNLAKMAIFLPARTENHIGVTCLNILEIC